MLKLWQFLKTHKFISIIIIIVLVIGGYYGYQKFFKPATPTNYVLGTVTRETIISSVSGTGQVSASNQVDVKAKASGDVKSMMVTAGQSVKADTLLLQLSSEDAAKAVRDAQISLDSARLALTKLKRGSRPEEAVTLVDKVTIAKTAVDEAYQDQADAETKTIVDLNDVYGDAHNILANSYDTVDDILNRQFDSIFIDNNGQDLLAFTSVDSQAQNYAEGNYRYMFNSLDKLKQLSQISSSDQSAMDAALNTANDQVLILQNFLAQLADATNGGVTSASLSASTLGSYKSTVGGAKTAVTTIINNLRTAQQSLYNQKITNQSNLKSAQTKVDDAKSNLTQAQNNLDLQNAGADPLDLKAQEINVQQKVNILVDAQSKYSDYSVRAPFDGVVAAISVKKGDTITSGASLITMVTTQQLAVISLNEVDVSKVKVGQKATLTFDAVSDLSISGSVAEVEDIGTVTQGVVSYNVKINFDTQDDRIKPGMTASATIIITAKQDVLAIPNAAIQTTNSGTSYVQILVNPITSGASVTSEAAPKQINVEIGLVNDVSTEIISGLNEGDQIIISTISTTATTASTNKSAGSLFGGGGGMR